MAVLPDGRVISASVDKTLRIWDVDTGKTLAILYGEAAFRSIVIVDSHRFVAGDALGNVWFLARPRTN
jgi:WD40 repeat protein